MLVHCDLVIGIEVGETNGQSVCILVDIWPNVFAKYPTAERDLRKGNCKIPILEKSAQVDLQSAIRLRKDHCGRMIVAISFWENLDLHTCNLQSIIAERSL